MQFNLNQSKNTIYFRVSSDIQNQFEGFLGIFMMYLPLDKSN